MRPTEKLLKKAPAAREPVFSRSPARALAARASSQPLLKSLPDSRLRHGLWPSPEPY